MDMTLWSGNPYPLGARWDGQGTNFALFSENATGVEVCLFDEKEQETRLSLIEVQNHIWHGYVQGVKPGQKYGFRVYGPYEPEKGHRFNPAKLLLDPYAKAIAGDVIYGQEIFNYSLEDSRKDPSPSLFYLGLDDAHLIPKAIVIDDTFDWEGDRLLQIPWSETIIYETHVKGFTKLHPDIPENLRGTYAGLAHPVAIAHLKCLGVTAVELLPVHHIFPCPQFLAEYGLRDYWGYRTLGYFAPYSGYSASGILGQQVTEFKQMVKNLHAAGIEVILDVVYNHTGEGNPSEPTLSWRGIDNAVYYRLNEDHKSEYLDFTGCGNSLNVSHPQVLKMILDSLRYWVTEMHIDGFRFDEAPTLARECFSTDYQIQLTISQDNNQSESKIFCEKITQIQYDMGAAFFDIIHQDPVLSQVKLIAEAWDSGDGGYQLGKFPILWSEWNDKYRNTMRDFWRGEQKNRQELINRFLGSPDLYKNQGKRPRASINFITCHDGFTLNDLVSYNEKHNEVNQENNKDGSNNNRSWNCGVEGETDDPEILQLRERQQRNFLTTLMLSHGVPMLLGGDEIGRTQQGNNNAYNQDNAKFSWYDWDLTEKQKELLQFTRQLLQFRRQYLVFQQRNWLEQGSRRGSIDWFNPDGSEISKEECQDSVCAIGIFLNSEGISTPDVCNDSFLMFFNGEDKMMEFALPLGLEDREWKVIIDTTEPRFIEESRVYQGSESVVVTARSLVVLQGNKI
ncbi:MAG: glycogen debranching enzyme [Hapalosiphonaceae cyanobacterium JJU2]|nr:MAG: glycogen debranching enzyme [Hapalosiphonaceae cyanobacterium JJU2]